ncbi:hypothetical protein, partial [Parasphingorhabdus sp.]|uniref:hypothetical protein n=1 Tax=Parasphingorhabdus sp. TaxID=2709688 RepID=UPI003001C95B
DASGGTTGYIASVAGSEQTQREILHLDGVQAANDETSTSEKEAVSSGNRPGSDEAPVHSGIAGGEAMIVEESSGNNDAQPGFDASEFQPASGLQLDMGIPMNVEGLAALGKTPAPVQIDIATPDTPPAIVEEIVADAIDGGSPAFVSIDAVIESFAGIEIDGSRGAIEHLPGQALPEQVLDMFVPGDAGHFSPGVSDGLQAHVDMMDAGHATV